MGSLHATEVHKSLNGWSVPVTTNSSFKRQRIDFFSLKVAKLVNSQSQTQSPNDLLSRKDAKQGTLHLQNLREVQRYFRCFLLFHLYSFVNKVLLFPFPDKRSKALRG